MAMDARPGGWPNAGLRTVVINGPITFTSGCGIR